MRTQYSLGTLFGIELRADWSWLFTFGLVVWYLNGSYFPTNYPEWTTGATLSAAIATSLLFFASILAHELGHSLISKRLGMPVPSITLVIFGGLAQLDHEPERARDEFLIAAAGPLVSFALALTFGLLVWAGPGVVSVPLAAFSQWLGLANLILGLFNLLPGFPLDGGRIVHAVLWALTRDFHKATRLAGVSGQVLAFTLIFWSTLLILQGDWGNGIWVAFVAWFISQATKQSITRTKLQELFSDHTAREIMLTDCPRVEPVMSLQKLVTNNLLKSDQHYFLVAGGSRIIGLISMDEVETVPRQHWENTTIGMAMKPIREYPAVSPNTGLLEVFKTMTESNIDLMPVMEDGQLVGLVGRNNILTFLQVNARSGI